MKAPRILSTAAVTAALLCTSLATTNLSASATASKPVPSAVGTVSVALRGLTDNKPVNPGYHGNVIFGATIANGRGALQEYVTTGRYAGTVRTINTFATAPSDVSKGPGGSYWILFGAAPEDGPGAGRQPGEMALQLVAESLRHVAKGGEPRRVRRGTPRPQRPGEQPVRFKPLRIGQPR